MPPAWVDFCQMLVREKRDNVKQISVIVVRMLATDREIIAEPIHKKSKRSSSGLSLWLERNRSIVKLSRKDATEAIAMTHRRVTEHFTPKGPPNPRTARAHTPEETDSENLPTDQPTHSPFL
jgi:hypothetical protein